LAPRSIIADPTVGMLQKLGKALGVNLVKLLR
jgi:hypothetical protein